MLNRAFTSRCECATKLAGWVLGFYDCHDRLWSAYERARGVECAQRRCLLLWSFKPPMVYAHQNTVLTRFMLQSMVGARGWHSLLVFQKAHTGLCYLCTRLAVCETRNHIAVHFYAWP